MSLENLKSAFSNIILPEVSSQKQGTSVSNLTSNVEKTTPDVNNTMQSNLINRASEYGIQSHPQKVDYLNNEKAPGFTPNYQSPPSLFTGVGGDSPNMTFSGNTLGYTNKDVEWPGPVNFIIDDKATGFTLNQEHMFPSLFTGINARELTFSGNTNLYTNSDYGDFPGPMDNFSNQKATGFTLNQIHKSPSRFVGVDGETPNMTWNNNSSLGGSIYGIELEPQEQNFIPIEGGMDYASGFTANRYHKAPSEFAAAADGDKNQWFGEHQWSSLYDIPSNLTNDPFGDGSPTKPVDFQKIYSSWTTPLTDYIFPNGFKNSMRESELAKGVSEQGDFSNSNFYSAGVLTHPGPVDFMNGNNSYYTPVGFQGSGSGVPGFTNHFGIDETGQDTSGYTFASDNKGNSKYLTADVEGNVSMLGTGNHQGWHDYSNVVFDGISGNYGVENGPSSYTGIPNPLDGTWNNSLSASTYYDSIHTVNSITDTMYGPVDFLGGNNSYYGSVNQQEDTVGNLLDIGIPGFTNNFNKGGYSFGDGLYGNSKYLTYGDTDLNPDTPDISDGGFISTGTHNRPLRDGSDTFIDFPGNEFSAPNFPGGFSNETPLGKSIFVPEILGDDGEATGEYSMLETTYFDSYGNTDPSLTFSDSGFNDLFNNSQITLRSGTAADINKGSNMGSQLSPQFKILYDNGAWQSSAKEAKYTGPPQDGSGINALERFNIKSDLWQYSNTRQADTNSTLFNLATLGIFSGMDENFGGKNEPYIVTDIGREDEKWYDDAEVFPTTRLQKDTVRLSKFLSSHKGAQFITTMNLLGTFQTYQTIYDPGSTIANAAAPSEGIGLPMVNIRKDYGLTGGLLDIMVATTYSEYLDRRKTKKNVAFNTNFGVEQEEKKAFYAVRDVKHKPLAAIGYSKLDDWAEDALDAIFPGANSEGKVIDVDGVTPASGIDSVNNMQNHMSPKTLPLGAIGKGDLHTLISNAAQAEDFKLEYDGTEGMPFYFKDLRNNSYVVFRAYLEGLSETVSPSWETTQYVGRSEPVYTYTNAEREIQMTLKLFAQTKDELNAIYKKMNHLTSLCYPEYKKDFLMGDATFDPATQDESEATGVGRVRMKPPLTKFRLGDLYGVADNGSAADLMEMSGFIKSLSYSFPDNGVWEIQQGKIVPKYIEVSLGYQVIHSTVPSLDFALKQTANQNGFYGINKKLFEEETTPVI